MTIPLTDDDVTQLGRWVVTGRSGLAWLASRPPEAKVRAVLIKELDRSGPATVFARVLGGHLGADPARLYAENWPRKAARLAAEARSRGDDPHADRLQAALVALMHCSNCGRPLADPVAIERGIGPDCWELIDPAWRRAISARISAASAAELNSSASRMAAR
jgi:hypothetical protein